MKRIKINKKEKIIISVLMATVLLALAIAFLLDYNNIPSKLGVSEEMNMSIWINALIGFAAAIVGGVITIMAVWLTIKDQEAVRLVENSVKALPMLEISRADSYDYKNKYLQFDCFFTKESRSRKRKDIPDTASVTLNIKNVGMRELYDLYIGDISSSIFGCEFKYHRLHPIIYKEQAIAINMSFYEMGSYDKDDDEEKYHTMINHLHFTCYFKDCYENWYYQKMVLGLMYNIMPEVLYENRALNISIEREEILSPPIKVDEAHLQWKDSNIISHY